MGFDLDFLIGTFQTEDPGCFIRGECLEYSVVSIKDQERKNVSPTSIQKIIQMLRVNDAS